MTDTLNTGTDSVLADWEVKRDALDLLRSELHLLNKAALFGALAAAGITEVIVTFDGYGDSGQIEHVAAESGDTVVALPDGEIEIATAAWGQSEPDRATVTIAEALERLSYDFLEQTHDGWENNDGAYGDFTFNVAGRTVTLDYNERYTDSEYSQHVF